ESTVSAPINYSLEEKIRRFSTEEPANLNLTTINGNWHDAATNSWSMTSGATGVLTNSPTGPTYDAAEEGIIGQMIAISPALAGNLVTLSFDYNVGTGNTLYTHLRAVNSSTTAWSVNTGAQNGNAWDTNTGGTTYNLFDGLTTSVSGSANQGDAGEAVSLTGSGNYSNTIDLSGYTISDLADYEWLMLGFAANATTDNTSTVSNLSLTVIPEPSSTVLVGLSALGLLRRRR
ncbi:MAG: PEP-CTERM sorting domain-containing protein, partial [Akkermansiaceae bacterium]|nr:PEP-CTERM sorting domain-containing protein [Akkermansiaceae bacterium]MDP4848447.1 PEP-CTERM sorting domain-containing protein [Akkermansiaceae bacterium]MDP4996397.1 PEP-CTERM sorting domain-containing protein [Akkermansiaceae bacterium]